MQPIPRGVEILVKKAAVDAEFRKFLLEERARAADRIGLGLEPAEAAMLDTIPARQLEQVIGRTTVPLAARAAFLGCTAAVMLATIAPAASAGDKHASRGINPDLEETKPEPVKGTGAVAGVCLEIGGGPADNVRIEILGTGLVEETSPDGFFNIDNVQPGTYDIRASGGAYAAKTIKGVEILADDVTMIEFALETIGEGGARPDMP